MGAAMASSITIEGCTDVLLTGVDAWQYDTSDFPAAPQGTAVFRSLSESASLGGLRRRRVSAVAEVHGLDEDLSETTNLAESKSDVAARLRQHLEKWRVAVDAERMLPNPAWDGRTNTSE